MLTRDEFDDIVRAVNAARGDLPDCLGLFPENAPIRQITRYHGLLLGGLRALVFQVSNPVIAQGVFDHSRFQEQPQERLANTLSAMIGLIFGDAESVIRSLVQIRVAHTRVKGVLAVATVPYRSGEAYTPRAAEDRWWVYATVVEAIAHAYGLLFGPLTAQRADLLGRDFEVLGTALRIDPAFQSDSWGVFRSKFDAVVGAAFVLPAKPAEMPSTPSAPQLFAHRTCSEIVFRLCTSSMARSQADEAVGYATLPERFQALLPGTRRFWHKPMFTILLAVFKLRARIPIDTVRYPAQYLAYRERLAKCPAGRPLDLDALFASLSPGSPAPAGAYSAIH